MSALYGVVRFDGRSVSERELAVLREPMAGWGDPGGGAWLDGCAGLGILHADRSGVPPRRRLPHVGARAVIAATGRLDNRVGLAQTLALPQTADDAEVLVGAYERWGPEAVSRLRGDWSLAAFHPDRRQLFLARDHIGQTSLHYRRDEERLLFSTSIKSLLPAGEHPRIDDLRVAQLLVVWPTDGAATCFDGVHRLGPGHTLTADPTRTAPRRYWSPADVPPADVIAGDCADALRNHLDRAVRARLPTPGRLASTLSAGLDSGAITAAAAAASGAPMTAYTAVPAFTGARSDGHIVDEWALAAATARLYPNLQHVAIRAAEQRPVAAIGRALEIHAEPEPAAGNLPWLFGILDAASEAGVTTLLTGQFGNGGMSWPGPPRPVAELLAQRRPLAAAREALAHAVRRSRARLSTERASTLDETAIHPELVHRTRLLDRMADAGFDPAYLKQSPSSRRVATLIPQLVDPGGRWHELGSTFGLDVRDPSADVDLLEFCLGLPDSQFAKGPWDRLLMRRASAGLLPDEVRFNRRRGKQGADLGHRLVADSQAVGDALEEIEASPRGATYVDVSVLRRQWRQIGLAPELAPFGFARALSVGLFVARVPA